MIFIDHSVHIKFNFFSYLLTAAAYYHMYAHPHANFLDLGMYIPAAGSGVLY